LILSENQASNSVMADYVNPIEYEAMTMVATQVMSNHFALTVASSIGDFKLNLCKPLIIKNILFSMRILRDVCLSFIDHFLVNIPLTTSTSLTPELPTNKSLFDNRNDIQDKLDNNDDDDTLTGIPESPLISMQRLIDNLNKSTSSEAVRNTRFRVQTAPVFPEREQEINKLVAELKKFPPSE
jgi:hypothetical protein